MAGCVYAPYELSKARLSRCVNPKGEHFSKGPITSRRSGRCRPETRVPMTKSSFAECNGPAKRQTHPQERCGGPCRWFGRRREAASAVLPQLRSSAVRREMFVMPAFADLQVDQCWTAPLGGIASKKKDLSPWVHGRPLRDIADEPAVDCGSVAPEQMEYTSRSKIWSDARSQIMRWAVRTKTCSPSLR